MSLFSGLSDLWQGLLCLLMLPALFLQLYGLLLSLRLRRRGAAVFSALLLLFAFCLMQVMIMNAFVNPFYPLGIRLRVLPVVLSCLALLTAAVLRLWRLRRWDESHVSPASVKEAFDRLPAGLCFYLPNGLIKLLNTSMDKLCQRALGAPLMDPAGFWQALERGELAASLRGGEQPMLRFEDGEVYSFRHRMLETELGAVHELVAVDVSRDWALNRELEEKQARAEALNRRLKALLGSIEYLTMSRELMELKTRLHDELGQSLLLSRRYLQDPGSVEARTVRESWLSKLKLLENSRPESWQRPYYVQRMRAEALGVRLELTGALPEENRLIPVVETALSVHTTNVMRHAGGSRAAVSCVKEAGGYTLCFTNDGAAPGPEAREGGGLSNLRSRVEALGGRMEIDWQPAFRLRLRLPAGEGEEEA